MSRASNSSLAIAGGDRTFSEPLHVGRPNLGDRGRLLERINDLLDRGWLSNRGPFVEEFEQRVADFLGVRHCVAMCNGTVALEIAIRALGMTGEVIVPSFTFVATAHALQWQEIAPVFCDIDRDTYNLDPGRVEDMITPRTTGIIAVDVFGRPCDMLRLTEIARRRGLRLLTDASHAFACTHHGRMVGSFDDAEVFSFHATKFMNTFEGGAVVTNDGELAEKMRFMKNFGFAGYDDVIHLGINGKMSEVAAAMGLTNLESFDEFVAVNRRNYLQYKEGLGGVPGVSLMSYDESERCNYQYIVVEVDEGAAGLSRDEMIAVLHAENVLARRCFYPGCHRMEPYRSYFPHAGLLLRETERLADRVVVLPTGTSISTESVSAICGIIRSATENADEVRQALLSRAKES